MFLYYEKEEKLVAPIVSIVGKSKSGKTSLLEKLIPELKGRGYSVGVIKHDIHDYEIDIPGKDSYKIKKAGAETVIISSPKKISMVKDVSNDEIDLGLLAFKYLENVDLILTEGYKKQAFPKIEVIRSEVSKEPICSPKEVMAFICDFHMKSSRPVFETEDIKKVTDFIEDRFLMKRKKKRINLLVGGKRIPLKGFVQDFIVNTVKGMISSLRGVDKKKKIIIRIEEEK